MNHSDDLIIFTNSYPFGTGESFLESEIDPIASYFERVTIQPATWSDSHVARPTPANVEVREPFLPENRRVKQWIALRHLLTHQDLRSELFKCKVLFSRARIEIYAIAVATKRFMGSILPELLADKEAPVLYFYWGCGAVYCLPEIRSLTKGRAVVRFHGHDLYEERSDDYLPLRQEIFTHADALCLVSDHGKRYIEDRYPEFGSKVIVARLGTRDYGKGCFAPNPDRITLVSCAALIPGKRINLLARLLSRHTGKSITWHHIGEGPERPNVEKAAEALPANVKLVLHGRLPNREVLSFFAKTHIDAFVSVSASEGVPVTIMEATSFGIPVIATDVGGTAEILHKDYSVLLPKEVEQCDFDGALRSIIEMSQQPEARKAIRSHWSSIASAEANYRAFASGVLLVR